ncbi:MAG: hypothetical protein LC775_03015 [Acidobacteria bacterium]|nr:hypothetical protein [Acidobacteriota bacterium]
MNATPNKLIAMISDNFRSGFRMVLFFLPVSARIITARRNTGLQDAPRGDFGGAKGHAPLRLYPQERALVFPNRVLS